MFKNVASQKVRYFAFDVTTGLPKTGDAGNIVPYMIKDDGTGAALASATITEIDSTNQKGWYLGSPSQAETNYNDPVYTAKSSTANISVVGVRVTTVPINFQARVISSTGIGDANVTQTLGSAALAPLPRYTGTATAGSATGITLAAATTALQCIAGDLIRLVAGTGAGQVGIVTDFNAATLIATIFGNWPIANPDGTTTYEILKTGGGIPATPGDIWNDTEAPTRILTAATNITSTNVAIPIAGTGNVRADISSLAANTITSAAIQDGAITANKLASASITSSQLDSSAANEIRDAVFAQIIENSKSFLECVRIQNADAAGKCSGMNTLSPRIRDLADSKDRISALLDVNGNRLSVTVDTT